MGYLFIILLFLSACVDDTAKDFNSGLPQEQSDANKDDNQSEMDKIRKRIEKDRKYCIPQRTACSSGCDNDDKKCRASCESAYHGCRLSIDNS